MPVTTEKIRTATVSVLLRTLVPAVVAHSIRTSSRGPLGECRTYWVIDWVVGARGAYLRAAALFDSAGPRSSKIATCSRAISSCSQCLMV